MSKFHQFRDDGNEGEDEKEEGDGKNNIINLIDRLEETGITSSINKKPNNVNDNHDNSSIFTKRTQKSYNKSQKSNANVKIPEEDFNNSCNEDKTSKSIKEQNPTTNYNLINLEINLNIDRKKHIQYKIAQKLPKIETTEGTNISGFNDTSNNMLTNQFDVNKYYFINKPKFFNQIQNYNDRDNKNVDLNVNEKKNEDNNNNNNNKKDNKNKNSAKKLPESNKGLSNSLQLKDSSFMEKSKTKKYTVKKNPTFICKIKCQCPRISFLVLFRNVCIFSIIVSSFIFYWLILFCN